MLKITFKDMGNFKMYTDIEKEFAILKKIGTPLEKKFISEIDQGEYLDSSSFIDRFGYKLRLSSLSTGCKAGIVVAHNPDKLIDITECGINARDAIIRFCKDGNIIMPPIKVDIYYEDGEDKDREILFDGYVFSSISRLNYYIQEESYGEPDFSIPGVRKYNM